jgi:Protein of unknown function (DUF2950)
MAKSPKWAMGAALGAVLMLVSCSSSKKPAETAATTAAPTTYASPEEAGKAVLAAATSGSADAMIRVLGPDSRSFVTSGDATEDNAALDSFVAKYNKMNRWAGMLDGSQVLYVGPDNYPFPVPLVKDATGKWAFDAQTGQDEILARRVGKNELLAIDAIGAIGNAEELYFKSAHGDIAAHQYTLRIISTKGTQDGLYWPNPGGEASPLGHLSEFVKDAATISGEANPPVFDGYAFRILTSQSGKAKGGAKKYVTNGKLTAGFAVLAYPVKYQDSGIMTFVMSREGVVYQKDLGPNTSQSAAAITDYNPDGWAIAE